MFYCPWLISWVPLTSLWHYFEGCGALTTGGYFWRLYPLLVLACILFFTSCKMPPVCHHRAILLCLPHCGGLDSLWKHEPSKPFPSGVVSARYVVIEIKVVSGTLWAFNFSSLTELFYLFCFLWFSVKLLNYVSKAATQSYVDFHFKSERTKKGIFFIFYSLQVAYV